MLLALFALAGSLVAAVPPAIAALASTATAVVAAAAAVGAVTGVTVGLARDTRARVACMDNRLRARADVTEAQLRQLSDQVGASQSALPSVVGAVEQRLRGWVEDTSRKHADQTQKLADLHFRQLESLLNLHALVDVRSAVPPSRGFAASPDLLLTYIGEILLRRPSLVVECGSGLSTLWAAYALQLCGEGRVVALEHDEHYLKGTRSLLAAHGIVDYSEVRHAAIRETKVGSETYPWYDTDEINDLYDVGVLLVDGPPGSLSRESRYPAVPIFRDRFSPGAAILLDDANRPEEQAITERWATEWPELSDLRLPHEKGTFLLHVPA